MLGQFFDVALLLMLTVILSAGMMLGSFAVSALALAGGMAWLAMREQEEVKL